MNIRHYITCLLAVLIAVQSVAAVAESGTLQAPWDVIDAHLSLVA